MVGTLPGNNYRASASRLSIEFSEFFVEWRFGGVGQLEPDLHRIMQEFCRIADGRERGVDKEAGCMDFLVPVAIILAVTWLFGVLTSNTVGGLIHALLVGAVITISIRVIQGRRLI